jgi:hypothetical protein
VKLGQRRRSVWACDVRWVRLVLTVREKVVMVVGLLFVLSVLLTLLGAHVIRALLR